MFAIAVVAALGGCAPRQQRRTVAARFRGLHACEAESVRSGGSGYVVTGCGLVVEYACTEYDPFPLFPGRGLSCVETSVRAQGNQPPPPATVVSERDEDGSLRLSATTALRGGQVTFVTLPQRFPERAVVRVFALGAGGEANEACTGDLLIDGVPVPENEALVESVTGGALYSALTELDVLTRMGPARRVLARVCGRDLALTSQAQRLAEDLAIRTREQTSRPAP